MISTTWSGIREICEWPRSIVSFGFTTSVTASLPASDRLVSWIPLSTACLASSMVSSCDNIFDPDVDLLELPCASPIAVPGLDPSSSCETLSLCDRGGGTRESVDPLSPSPSSPGTGYDRGPWTVSSGRGIVESMTESLFFKTSSDTLEPAPVRLPMCDGPLDFPQIATVTRRRYHMHSKRTLLLGSGS